MQPIIQLYLFICMPYFLHKRSREQDAKLLYVTETDLQRDSLCSPFDMPTPAPALRSQRCCCLCGLFGFLLILTCSPHPHTPPTATELPKADQRGGTPRGPRSKPCTNLLVFFKPLSTHCPSERTFIKLDTLKMWHHKGGSTQDSSSVGTVSEKRKSS